MQFFYHGWGRIALGGLFLSLFLHESLVSAQPNPDPSKVLQPALGLKVETFASEPLFFNPVSFSIDDRGRFFIAETHRYKDAIFDLWQKDDRWRLADFSWKTVDDRRKFLENEFATNISFLTRDSEIVRMMEMKNGKLTSSIFAQGFNQIVSGTAAGVLARNGEVWLTCIPDLVKLSYDTNGVKTSQEVLHSGYGVHVSVSGHDLHGLVMGPDGRLYFSVGDRGANVLNREGTRIDLGQKGGIFRCNPDGTSLELFATGFRNPQELAFDAAGNLWTHDNDTAGADEPRLIYVVEGGDYGWRQSYQFMEGFGPWVEEGLWRGDMDDALPNAGVAGQGPAGLAFYPGVGLPEKYQGALLGCDFPQGVWAYFVKSKGAAFTLEKKEHFLWNLGCTDVAFGPDGGVYVSDWGKSYNMPNAGKIFRVAPEKPSGTAAVVEVQKLLNAGMGKRNETELASLLGHADMRVRLESQFEMVKRGAVGLAAVKEAAHSGNTFARLHALWGLEQLSRTNEGPFKSALLECALTAAKDGNSEIRAQGAKMLGEGKFALGSAELKTLIQDANARVRFFATMSLGKLHQTNASEAIFKMLVANADEDAYLRHAGVWALQNIGDKKIIKAAAAEKNPVALRHAALLVLRRMADPDISDFLTDGDPKLILEAARAINDVPIAEAYDDLRWVLNQCPCEFQQQTVGSLLKRGINANYRLGQSTNILHLVEFLSKPEMPEESKIEGLHALGVWNQPSPLDRVVGLWRPLTGGRAVATNAEVSQLLLKMLSAETGKVAVAAIDTIGKLNFRGMSPALLQILKTPGVDLVNRRMILSTLATLNTPELGDAVELAITDKDASIQVAGIDATAKLAPEKAVGLLAEVLNTQMSAKLLQSAFVSLGQISGPEAQALLEQKLSEMFDRKLVPEVQLDLVEAAERMNVQHLKELLGVFEEHYLAGDEYGLNRLTLSGGDREKGLKVFESNDAIGCQRCHSVKNRDNKVGPALNGVGTRFSKQELLESIVFPNRKIAAGFETVTLFLKNGEAHAGLVKQETENELTLEEVGSGQVILKKSDIEIKKNGISPMPEGLVALMSRRDLRDLIEFLSSLK